MISITNEQLNSDLKVFAELLRESITIFKLPIHSLSTVHYYLSSAFVACLSVTISLCSNF